eukprot:3796093-Rhodomonas_salina.1
MSCSENKTTQEPEQAACYLKEGKFFKAIKDCDDAIALDRNWPRGYERKAQAFLDLHRLEEASTVVSKGLTACGEEELGLKRLQDKVKQQLFFSNFDITNEADSGGTEQL